MRSTFLRLSCGALLLAGVLGSSSHVIAAGSLFEAIRRNDVAAVKTLVDRGADVKAPDDSGATPLMHAALYAGPECVQLLLDRGAGASVANQYGSTPLMWAASWSAKNVDLLLSRGADVNARASDGVTALVVAARFSNVDAMRALLAAAADTTVPTTRTNLLTAAYFAPTRAVRDLLETVGVVVKSAADVKGPVLARNRGDLHALNTLLQAGVDPKEEVPLITLTLPSFFLAAREGQVAAMQAFVEAGVDPTAKAGRGWTALMLSAGGDTASIPAMQYLIDAGVDVNARDDEGRTALDWATTRGETEASSFLRSAGGRSAATTVPAPALVPTPRPTTDAIERAVARLQPVGPAFYERTKCNSCHNQNIPGMAISLAQRHGIKVDEALAGHSMTASNQQWRRRREAVLLGDTTGGGFQPNSEYTLLEMAEAHIPATPNSDAMVLGLASRQSADGSWPVVTDIRPPLTGTTVTSTALAIRALHEYAPDGRRDEMQRRVVNALAFLRQAAPRDTQEQSFKLLGLVWAGAPHSEIANERRALVALQRADGGWAQMASMTTDAYASGQALHALHAANMSPSDPVYRKGADYLLRTQLDDGTWFVRTRAFGFQPYFETGFPHGRSQFISTVATSWATVALTNTLDNRPSSSQGR